MFARSLTAILLILSALNLGMMIPGGVVETRSFPDYAVTVILLFNVALAVLGIGSLLLSARIFRHGRGLGLARLAALSYLAVYILDLANIFPISYTPMSTTLWTLEWIGVGLGAILLAVALKAKPQKSTKTIDALSKTVVIALIIIVIAIVGFATYSAL